MNENANNNKAENQNMDINTDENISGTTHLNDPVAEASALEKINAELEESKDKYLRLAAEFDNFKRRNAKEKIELIQESAMNEVFGRGERISLWIKKDNINLFSEDGEKNLLL